MNKRVTRQSARDRVIDNHHMSGAMFDAIFMRNAASMSIVRLSDGRYLAVNNAWLRIFGNARKEVVGKNAVEIGLWVGQGTQTRSAIYKRLRANKNIRNFEISVRNASGKQLVLLMSASVADLSGERVIIASATDITKRKCTEELLAAIERRHRTFLEVTSEWIWRTNASGQDIGDFQELRKFSGFSARWLAANGWLALLHPDDRRRVAEAWARSVATGSKYEIEYRMRRKNGAYRWILARAVPVRDARDNVLEWCGTCLDVTEKKEREIAVARSEEKLHHAMEAAQAGSWQANPATGEFSASARALQIHGLPADAVLTQQSAMANVYPDDRPRVEAAVQHAMASGESLRLEHRVQWPDGTLHWVEAYAQRQQEGGEFVLAGFVRDITERKEIEARLSESSHLLELALSGGGLGTWDTDIASGASRYDERYCAMLGYTKEEFEPTMAAWLRLVHPDDQAKVNEAVRAHLAGEVETFEVEHRLRHKQGHWVWVLARGKITYDAEGRPVRATGIHENISNRKRVAKEGADLLENLQHLISSLDAHGSRPGVPRSEPRTRTRLSGRNREVLELIAEGRTAAQMAEALSITESTAKTHRRNLMRKLGVSTKADLIRYAIKHGIIKA